MPAARSWSRERGARRSLSEAAAARRRMSSPISARAASPDRNESPLERQTESRAWSPGILRAFRRRSRPQQLRRRGRAPRATRSSATRAAAAVPVGQSAQAARPPSEACSPPPAADGMWTVRGDRGVAAARVSASAGSTSASSGLIGPSSASPACIAPSRGSASNLASRLSSRPTDIGTVLQAAQHATVAWPGSAAAQNLRSLRDFPHHRRVNIRVPSTRCCKKPR